jgi:hypothetical protein
VENERHPEKAFSPTNSTEAGRQTDSSDRQLKKALAPIPVSFEPDSNVNDESELQPEKGFSPTNSTEAGKQINSNDEHLERASASIRVSLDPDSNVNDESDLHPQKEPEAGRAEQQDSCQ